MTLERRTFLKALGTVFLLPAPGALADQLRPSLPMDLGPFYPVEKPLEQDADLTRLKGHTSRAKGEVIEVTGRVLRIDGTPVPKARLELWQANAAGRYHHHGDDHAQLPIDPDFQGYALQEADGDGRFRFLTIKPGAYPAGQHLRSPHIHFDVEGKYTRLVTQMYLPAAPEMLAQDVVLQHDLWGQNNPIPQNIFGKLTPGASTAEKGATLCEFDIVLENG